MPGNCRCGGRLVGITPDSDSNTEFFEAKCDACGVVHRQGKRVKERGKNTWPFHKILEACMDRHPEQQVGQILIRALSLYGLPPAILHVSNEDLKKALIHYIELPENG